MTHHLLRKLVLLISSLALAAPSLAEEDTLSQEGMLPSEVPAEQPAQIEDPCFDALIARSSTAERTCSDTVAALESLLAPNPADLTALISAYNNRAVVRMREGDLEGAGEDLSRAMTLAPENWSLYLNRGNLMLALDEPQSAIADYDTARNLSGRSLPEALGNAAFAHRAMGDPLGAERLLRASRIDSSGLGSPRSDNAAPPGNPPR
jgi:Flp pilus assembly protein TadD